MQQVICCVHIEFRMILLVNKKDTWILPGGKPIVGESHEETLLREIREELPKAKAQIGNYIDVFYGMAPNKGYFLKCHVYFAKLDGEFEPAREITESKMVSKEDAVSLNLSAVTRKIIKYLVETGHL